VPLDLADGIRTNRGAGASGDANACYYGEDMSFFGSGSRYGVDTRVRAIPPEGRQDADDPYASPT
jgi:hypothetical protein